MKSNIMSNLISLMAYMILVGLSSGCHSQSSNTSESNKEFTLFEVNGSSQSTLSEYSTSLNILTLGDSRVEGYRPEYESYRFELWKRLIQTHLSFDLIGPLSDEAEYPLFDGQRFDPDHGGVGGFTTEDLLISLNDFIDDIERPDLILLGIGGNDLTGDIPLEMIMDHLNQILDLLKNKNPQGLIFLELIAPGHSSMMTPEFQDRLSLFHQAVSHLAEERTDLSIRLVDQFSGWTDQYLADDVHYNRQGAQRVAERYFEAILSELGQQEGTNDNEVETEEEENREENGDEEMNDEEEDDLESEEEEEDNEEEDSNEGCSE